MQLAMDFNNVQLVRKPSPRTHSCQVLGLVEQVRPRVAESEEPAQRRDGTVSLLLCAPGMNLVAPSPIRTGASGFTL